MSAAGLAAAFGLIGPWAMPDPGADPLREFHVSPATVAGASIGDLGCESADADEIVVCARRETPTMSPRSPIPYAPDPGRRIRGEAPGNFGCLRLCEQPIGVSIPAAIGFIGRAIRNLRERAD